MNLRRNNIIHSFCEYITRLALYSYHKIEYEGSENIPSHGPALLLPKHTSLKDIMLEGAFLKGQCNRYGNWVMKSGLPGMYSLLGGIKIKRPKDIKKIKDKKKRRAILEQAKEFNKQTIQYIEWIYRNGEIVIVHPEGTRTVGKVNTLKKELVDFTLEISEKYSLNIPVIPIGIEYESLGSPRSKVYLRAGKQLDIKTPNLMDIVRSEISRLSNMNL
ncbi:MAG: 1-acyl-sn-glycerol-3-phosphate acyltransferase [archaeon]|nr:1-acyl-sn-glycerol-3-phosphate acyltransferase [archaeon]